MDPTSRRWLVFGKVQGVFFRDSTRREAQRLSLSGSARNLPDGSVEVLACGEREALEELRIWLGSGPKHARVDEVREIPLQDAAPIVSGFEIS